MSEHAYSNSKDDGHRYGAGNPQSTKNYPRLFSLDRQRYRGSSESSGRARERMVQKWKTHPSFHMSELESFVSGSWPPPDFEKVLHVHLELRLPKSPVSPVSRTGDFAFLTT